MPTLRRALLKHESGDRLRASLTALMRVIVQVVYVDGTSEAIEVTREDQPCATPR